MFISQNGDRFVLTLCFIRRLLAVGLIIASEVGLIGTAAGQVTPSLAPTSGANVLIATNRKRSGTPAQSTRAFTSAITDTVIFARVRDTDLVSGAERDIPIQELSRPETSALLQKRENRAPGDILLYVHGFNNSIESAANIGRDVANKMDFGGQLLIFSWPSRGNLLSYAEDIRTADASTKQLLELLTFLGKQNSVERVHILAHSLGNDPVTKALAQLEIGQGKIGELILCSPDVGREEFIQRMKKFGKTARGATLWVSDSDVALEAARALGRGIRAGQVPAGLGPIVLDGLDTIDVSREARLFARNHNAYSQVDALFADLSGLFVLPSPIRRWRIPGTNSHYIKKEISAGTYWEYIQ
jgi:esterase/lipase superfamily enzyme